jgi:D-alanyl-D-alanine carboxypeptidase
MRQSRSTSLAVVAAIGLVVGACGSTDPTTDRPTTTTTVHVPGVAALLAEQAGRVSIPSSGGAFMVAVGVAGGEVEYAADGTDPEGIPPTPDSPFRIASITKVLTSLIVLSLVDEGLVDLDTPAVDYVSRVPVPEEVTIRDLLQHTSGIPEFFDDPYLEVWLAEPSRIWMPEETIALIVGEDPVFPPGSEWHWGYSNTNYIVLGVMIEEVTGRSLADELRRRITEPLGMTQTYLAGFEDGADPIGAYASFSPREPAQPIAFDFTSIATSAWAAGGVVSTARDLHILFTGVFDGQIVSPERLTEMTGVPGVVRISENGNQSDYGLGIQVWDRFGGRSVEGLVGHRGDVVGYQSLVVHAPATGMTAIWLATNPWIDPSSSYSEVAEHLSGGE